MYFLRIIGQHPYLTQIRPWYEQSFPVEERRSFDQLLQILNCPDMHVVALVDDEHPVGFIIYWQWESLVYIEHFAIDPDRRGQQLGQKALQLLLKQDASYVVLEVELPTDDMSRRRIQFYERQGFSVNAFDYRQPPYRLGGTEIPMKLMSQPAIPDQETCSHLSQQLRDKVYERFY
ncbi:GNAT family N-acetyltransferase [Spirosoma endbachense]|uniref:GNAT family N-acetyltransferase n=1 Tax=Spirosoma endbachense TaxID=2666025 RepID=A0A6P1WAD2_9BACT|nr:GNAT family N-acetyltransferase [Spirosoma endbachense]QHW00851.1 GNAT family N-acetyltransferase [Spirosoma endbachense]